MSDPAEEAARRAFAYWRSMGMKKSADVTTVTAAREALAPLRELHKPWREYHHDGMLAGASCKTCAHDDSFGLVWQQWPCATAKLIYSDEELNDA